MLNATDPGDSHEKNLDVSRMDVGQMTSSAIVPISLPLTTGAGTMSTITVYAEGAHTLNHRIELFAAIWAMAILIGLMSACTTVEEAPRIVQDAPGAPAVRPSARRDAPLPNSERRAPLMEISAMVTFPLLVDYGPTWSLAWTAEGSRNHSGRPNHYKFSGSGVAIEETCDRTILEDFTYRTPYQRCDGEHGQLLEST
jgi:hypothetical protein